MKNKIYFRADGNAEIGLGHLTRCLALAQMLQSKFDVTFLCKEIDKATVAEIHRLLFSLIEIDNEEDVFNYIGESDIVVLDHYGLTTEIQIRIKAVGCKLVCIDDIHNKTFFADLIINHAPNVKPSDYNAQHYTQFAIGLDYVLLRPIFLKLAKDLNRPNNIENAFVCFGGSDFKNITQVTVEILKQDKRFKHIDVVVGNSYQHLDQLKQIISNDERFVLHIGIDSNNVAQLIMQAGLAIVPASGILQEVLSIGCRTISGMYIDNQKNIFENYLLLNAFISAGDFSRSNIYRAIDIAFNLDYKVPTKLIDGFSGDRILRLFEQLILENQVLLRRATEDDLSKTFEWASNPIIRKFFFNVKPVHFEEHKNWFKLRLLNPNSFYYIGLINSKEFGSIRFDIQDDKAIVSYLIDPKFQGAGLGTVLLKKGIELISKQDGIKISLVQGEVLKENVASVKIFKKLGYNICFDDTNNLFKFEKIIRN